MTFLVTFEIYNFNFALLRTYRVKRLLNKTDGQQHVPARLLGYDYLVRLEQPDTGNTMKYEDFVSLLTTGQFTEKEFLEYDQYEIDRRSEHPVAGGGFADIFHSALNNNNQVAIKTWKRPSPGSLCFKYREMIEAAYNWSQIRHENINVLLGFTTFQNTIGLVSYWASNGIIQQYIHNRPSVDLMEDGTAKLIDFETSVLEQNAWVFKSPDDSPRYAMRWAAPEIFQDEPVKTRASDVYGLAMV
ncbi:protein tyrosine kinase domain-containing protein [Rhizoctonia solani AG-1 IA]|uniref:Protein tyrosine kinase domain-containing protein n=1 Tax=Thanatephorus cucumeris (strain AG1-IA) TaxID=983506 RepID=L8WMA7_THACA|nr:protein tyrosine kinase domain-containing protein [Rhizoctonia solani AG-1 IA]